MKTLLQKAKEEVISKKKVSFSQEEMELAVAWAKGEVSSKQVKNALNTSSGEYLFLSRALRAHILSGGKI